MLKRLLLSDVEHPEGKTERFPDVTFILAEATQRHAEKISTVAKGD